MNKQFLILIIILSLSYNAFSQKDSDSLRIKYRPVHPQDVKFKFGLLSGGPTKTKKLSLRLSGFVRLIATLDFGNVQNTSDFITSMIPIYPIPKEEEIRTSFDARQSRFAFEGVYQVTPTNKLLIYMETDFFGSEPALDYKLHLRHAYAQYGSWLLGYSWSTAANIDATPNQVDFEGANSVISPKNAQIRYNLLREKYSFAISLESHLGDYTPYVGINDITDFQSSPDLISYFQTQGDWGNIRLTGILTGISYTDSANIDVDHMIGWGVSFSGHSKVFSRDKISDEFYWGFTYGEGIAYYISDISGLGYNAMPDSNGVMNTLPAFAGYLAYKHAWNEKFESNIIASYLKLESDAIKDKTILKETVYLAANLMYTPIDRVNFGIEFLYGKNVNQKQDFGEAYRIQLMSVFNF